MKLRQLLKKKERKIKWLFYNPIKKQFKKLLSF